MTKSDEEFCSFDSIMHFEKKPMRRTNRLFGEGMNPACFKPICHNEFLKKHYE